MGILGHNGSGKSTLAKQLAALLKPSSGVIYVGGMDTAKEEQTSWIFGRQQGWYFKILIIS